MDMKPVQRHNREMRNLETGIMRQLAAEWRAAYVDLSAAVQRNRINSTPLLVEIRRVINGVGARITTVMKEAAPAIRLHADDYVTAQVGPGIADAARAQIEQPTIPTAEPWVLAASARYLLDIQRLQTATPEDAFDALLSLSETSGGRQSTFSAVSTQLAAWGQQSVWTYANRYLDREYEAVNRTSREQFQRQAIAAIDDRTSDCCLQVHGQIVGFDEPFQLTGTPRYADEMMGPPFHWFCRTALALYRPEYESRGLSTAGMKAAANEELERRKREKATSPRRRPAPTRTVRRNLEPWRYDPKLSAEENEARRLQWTWVHGSNSKNGVLLKTAVRDELDVQGLLHNPRGHIPAADDILQARGGVRLMYENTQEYYRSLGISEVTLYRGVKSNVITSGVAESWTTNAQIAQKFDGYTVIKETIPVERLLTSHEVPGWRNGWYGQQAEFIVLPQRPGGKR